MDIKQKLIDVLKNNPELTIKCQIENECYADDYYYSMGNLLDAEIMTIYELEECTLFDEEALREYFEDMGHDEIGIEAAYNNAIENSKKVIMLTVGIK